MYWKGNGGRNAFRRSLYSDQKMFLVYGCLAMHLKNRTHNGFDESLFGIHV